MKNIEPAAGLRYYDYSFKGGTENNPKNHPHRWIDSGLRRNNDETT